MGQSAPKILLIVREPVKPGAEREYDRIETETAVSALKLKCPHPYLALKPLSGAKNEVWWLNEFDSQNEIDSVGNAYKTNAAWNAALTTNQKRKASLTKKPIEQLADLETHGDASAWTTGRARYLVIAANPTELGGPGHVYKGRDGTRYEIVAANEREQADRVARGNKSVLLEVVPRWSFAAREWVEANRELWKAQPE